MTRTSMDCDRAIGSLRSTPTFRDESGRKYGYETHDAVIGEEFVPLKCVEPMVREYLKTYEFLRKKEHVKGEELKKQVDFIMSNISFTNDPNHLTFTRRYML